MAFVHKIVKVYLLTYLLIVGNIEFAFTQLFDIDPAQLQRLCNIIAQTQNKLIMCLYVINVLRGLRNRKGQLTLSNRDLDLLAHI